MFVRVQPRSSVLNTVQDPLPKEWCPPAVGWSVNVLIPTAISIQGDSPQVFHQANLI